MHRVTNDCDAQTVPWLWCVDLFWCGWLPGEIRHFVVGEWMWLVARRHVMSCDVIWCGDVVTCFDVVGCRERWSNAVGCEVTWGEVMWLVARCHIMSCDVIWCVFILCDAISCVVWCHVMHCDVMWCPLMWWAVICCEVMRCNGIRSYEFVMHCGWLRCHVVWFEMVVWGELQDDLVIRTTQIYSVLHSTTKYYSGTSLYYTVLLQYYSVLQSTTPVLILYYKVLLQYYSVLESTTPVLLCTTKYYSSTTLYYKVLLQYYSVLHSTTPVLRLYYKVLLQCYSVLQSTTPVLLCTTKYYSCTTKYLLLCTTKYYSSTTKYYSSTSLYYKVLLQYYSVLHRTTPVLLCTTKYYSSTNSVLQSTTPVLLCTTQIYTSTTLYYSVLQSTTPVLLCTTKYYSGTTPCTTKYAFARREAPTSPNAAPATQGDSHDWSSSHMKRHLQCAEQQDSSSNVTKYCTCHAKWLSWVMSVTYETSFTMRGATGVIHQRHQVLCLPRKMTRIINPRDTWNVIYNARNNRHHPSTSPNAVPATQGDSHD